LILQEIYINSALHNWFKDQYGVEEEDVDIVFDVVDHRPTFYIDVADNDDDDGDDEDPKDPTPKFDKEIKKIKEDIENN